jgi:UDP-N-acetylmuramate: L-alanyl-gamma-D-glutamyl-meso-diaminopimelate ligase
MGSSSKLGALIHPAGKVRLSTEERGKRLQQLTELGLNLTEFVPEIDEQFDLTAGKPLDRAILLAQSLTLRKFSYIWAARGGFGTTELIPFLENLLPPVLPPKLFIGFSDNSFLGNYLAARYPNLTYVHANHAFDPLLLDSGNTDTKLLFQLIRGETPKPQTFDAQWCSAVSGDAVSLTGPCIPFNLSLAESFAALRHVSLPDDCILFLEDINEELFRVQRKFDSLINAGFIEKCSAIVLGSFSDCKKADGSVASEMEIAQLLSRKSGKPVLVLKAFGHEQSRLPLVAYATTCVQVSSSKATVEVSFCAENRKGLATEFAASLFPIKNKTSAKARPKLHFTGIGGTGMAAVAGLFSSAGFAISGSDNPIYPPMDAVIKHIGLEPVVGYHESTLQSIEPDGVVLANVISRKNAELKPNPEMHSLLELNLPTMSFPSALRRFFLHKTKNIVVSGTHGKTSTTSLIAQMLSHLGRDPSLFVGGSPANFQHGFRLGSGGIFVLEGDEYDSALFDKGPKFLHYEPSIALINNIEFDHADIYPNIEAIEEEFYRLACLTRDRGGVVVANRDDQRVVKVVERAQAPVIWFGKGNEKVAGPVWQLASTSTETEGLSADLIAPDKSRVSVKTRLFGLHNAMNTTAAFAVLHALKVIDTSEVIDPERLASAALDRQEVQSWCAAAQSFLGVKRRFELISSNKDIVIFDDFAHHPTAITTTLDAFRSYVCSAKRTGRLIVCFDPRNATMRRSVLQEQLAQSFKDADVVLLGQVPVDMRLQANEVLDGKKVAELIGTKAQYFAENEKLLEHLKQTAQAGDTIVFMSSGSFDGLPRKLQNSLADA